MPHSALLHHAACHVWYFPGQHTECRIWCPVHHKVCRVKPFSITQYAAQCPSEYTMYRKISFATHIMPHSVLLNTQYATQCPPEYTPFFILATGIRDTRMIIGKYDLTQADVLDQARFDDSIGIFPEFVDGYLPYTYPSLPLLKEPPEASPLSCSPGRSPSCLEASAGETSLSRPPELSRPCASGYNGLATGV